MTQTLSDRVAAAVRAECARKQVSQSQVAEALGMSQAGVSRRFRGETPFELDELPIVAELLDVRIGDLVSAA